MLDQPSPKLQDRDCTEPSPSVLVSVKSHVSPVQLHVKDAVGGLLGSLAVPICAGWYSRIG